ncbi:hypothetical protein TEA_029592 [Camellia sinensis var. sinensis]|uniref:Uncharacterized protein n=1 Tax=Camellia sinensis var. sinensis TaxID=542762 RepID=A0A4S4DPZ9_CAMSN|nr:hypothetical protein TEA_029592 [Camellia sinensis var. sinensis]
MGYEDQYRQAQRPKYDCLLFDLDDTLYPLSTGLAAGCCKNIGDYMVEKLGIDKNKIPELSNLLYKNYGTTMAGLRAIGYDFDYDDYHSFVHGRLPYENLKPDPVLRSLLLNLPIRKVSLTRDDTSMKSVTSSQDPDLEDPDQDENEFAVLAGEAQPEEDKPNLGDFWDSLTALIADKLDKDKKGKGKA